MLFGTAYSCNTLPKKSHHLSVADIVWNLQISKFYVPVECFFSDSWNLDSHVLIQPYFVVQTSRSEELLPWLLLYSLCYRYGDGYSNRSLSHWTFLLVRKYEIYDYLSTKQHAGSVSYLDIIDISLVSINRKRKSC